MINYADKNGTGTVTLEPEQSIRSGPEAIPSAESKLVGEAAAKPSPSSFATRARIVQAEGISKSKLLILGGGLAVAVLFFVFTAVVGKSPKKRAELNSPQQQTQ